MNRLSVLVLPFLLSCGGSQMQTEPRFVAVHNALSAMGMAQTGPISEGSLPEGATAEIGVVLQAGQCYTFVALGSDSVDDLDIRILDESEEEIGRDVTHDRQAAARVCAETTGPHTAVIEMRDGRGGYLVSSWSGAPGSAGLSGGMVAAGGSGVGTCAAPIDLALGEAQSGDTTGGTNAMQAPCAEGQAPERIYRLQLEQRAQVSITLQSSFDGALFLARNCGDLDSVLACNDDAGDTAHSRIDTTLEEGTYFVVVDGYGTGAGAFEIQASITPLRPLQEVCNDAPPLQLGQAASGSTQGAADYFQATCADGARMPDRVYQLEVPARSRLRVRQQTDHDGALYMRSRCVDPTTEVACNDDFADTRRSVVTSIVDPGQYFVVADGFGSGGQVAAGNFTLTAELAPENGRGGIDGDACGRAIPVPTEAFSVDTFEATDTLAGSCGGQGGPEVVYELQVRNRSKVTVRVKDSEFEGAVYLRRTCGQEDTEIGCTAIPFSSPRTQEASLETVLDPGRYSLVFDGARPDSFGSAQVSVDVRDLVEMQRMCRQAPLLRPGRTTNDTTAGQTDDFHATCAEGARSGDRVYRLRLTRRSKVRVEMTSDYDGALHLRSDCADPATEVACNDDVEQDNRRSRIEATLDRGTYFVFVDGFREGSEGSYSIEVDVSRP